MESMADNYFAKLSKLVSKGLDKVTRKDSADLSNGNGASESGIKFTLSGGPKHTDLLIAQAYKEGWSPFTSL